MNITITGATGFIGRRLIEILANEPGNVRHQLHALSRRTNIRFGETAVWISKWDPMTEDPPAESLANADAIVHLAGEQVAQRWTPEAKARIRESRVRSAQRLVGALAKLPRRPSTLVCASAIGIYGSRGDEILTETSAPGNDYLAEVCRAWEEQAVAAEKLGIRVARIRIGVVLGRGGGALQKMLPPFRAFVGGKIGSGKQWMSWIHLDDMVGILRHAIMNPMSGVFNATAPNPVTNEQFTAELAKALSRPALFPVPGFALKAMFGEMSEILLGGQRVLPRATEAAGYRFQYPGLAEALRKILAGPL
jgi:uncharacterized protein (TIGR01777 family)